MEIELGTMILDNSKKEADQCLRCPIAIPSPGRANWSLIRRWCIAIHARHSSSHRGSTGSIIKHSTLDEGHSSTFVQADFAQGQPKSGVTIPMGQGSSEGKFAGMTGLLGPKTLASILVCVLIIWILAYAGEKWGSESEHSTPDKMGLSWTSGLWVSPSHRH